jgi:hypothetical protein
LIVRVPDSYGSSFSNLSVNCYVCVELVYPTAPIAFRHRNGLPIQISTKITSSVKARCMHGIDNILSVATLPYKIEWLIDGKRETNGAFKIGHSDQAEYHSRDYGECVIYHPPLELTRTPKEIEIRLRLKHATGNLEYRVCIALQLQKGFGKGLSSLANITVKPVNQVKTTSHDENKKCEICEPKLVFNIRARRIVLAGTVHDSRYLMTSQYIKMISSSTDEKEEEEEMKFTSRVGKQIPLDSLSPSHDLKWYCSAGKFVGSNTGRSVIYLTPDESGLSKSPVTITLQEDERTVASRRFWLLRGSSIMHC